MALVMLMALQVAAPGDAQDLKAFGPLPRDVAAFIDRRMACNHFSGEFNGDHSERDREVFKTMDKLRCGALEPDEKRLARRYARSPAVLKALAETRDWQ